MNRTVDSYTVRHRLTFTPDEVLAGLVLLFPDTFRDLDEKRIEVQFDDGDLGPSSCEISWTEHRDSISEQIKTKRQDYENWGPSDLDLAHGPTPSPNETVREIVDRERATDDEVRSRYQKNDFVIISAYPGEGVMEGSVIEDYGDTIDIMVKGVVRRFVPGVVRLAT